MELVKTPGTEEFPVALNTVEMRARQHVGIGYLNVDTGRGEVKAFPGDFIISCAGEKFVLSATVFELLARTNNPKVIPLASFVERKIFNSKSGPDKFGPPMDGSIVASAEPEEKLVAPKEKEVKMNK